MELVSIGRNPVPSGAHVGHVITEDGLSLRYARWSATRQPDRGTVCVFPGRNEFIEKYFETVSDLRRRGFAVAVLDWRGQGGSSRMLTNTRKGHIGDFSEYDKDLNEFSRQVVLPECPPPYFALGHSMGGHILIRQTIRTDSWFRYVIVSAPMMALHPKSLGLPATIVAAATELAVKLGFDHTYAPGQNDHSGDVTKFEDNPLTSDRERFTRNLMVAQAAPRLTVGGPTFAWLAAAMRSMRRVARPEFAAKVCIPTMIVSAGEDTIVDPAASEAFIDRIKAGSLVSLPKSRHEILQERDAIRGRFWAAFDGFLGVDT